MACAPKYVVGLAIARHTLLASSMTLIASPETYKTDFLHLLLLCFMTRQCSNMCYLKILFSKTFSVNFQTYSLQGFYGLFTDNYTSRFEDFYVTQVLHLNVKILFQYSLNNFNQNIL